MKSLAKKVQRFLVSEDGPTAVEYAVMLALIVIVCLAAIQAIGTELERSLPGSRQPDWFDDPVVSMLGNNRIIA